MKICIVNYEDGYVNGILSKYARSMEKELLDLGIEVTVKGKPDPKADINHHINYMAAQKCKTLNTTMVTHFTSDMYELEDKINRVKEYNAVGICFSKGIKKYLIKNGVAEDKLEVVDPAHDGMKRRPRIIAMAYKIYPDGRKREDMFEKMFLSLKRPENYLFRIMGEDWRPILDRLSKKGLQIQWTDVFSMDLYEQMLNTSDYLLYTGGEDAAAQCIVDAKNAGLRIISPTVDEVEVDIPWKTQKELNKIFTDMDVNEVENWTWENYAKNHVKIWKKMLKSI